MTDTELLLRCRELIARKLSWPPADEWRNYEFDELSEKILEATGTGLSTTTLKRVFGKVQYNNLPSSFTLNTLAKYLGYESWMQFKAQHTPSTDPVRTIVHPRRAGKITSRSLLVATAVTGLLVICGFVFFQGSSKAAIDLSGIVFNSKPLAKGLPNSVVFKFDLKNVKSDSLLIQQYWDSTKIIRIKPGQTEATGIYYRPGYYRAKLLADGTVLKEHDLFITSEEWMVTIDQEPVPMYFDKDQLSLSDSLLSITPAVTDIISESTEPLTMTYHIVKPFGLESDNFTLEASLRNTFGEGPAVCRTGKIFVLCTDGAFIIPFSIPGCVSDINLKLGNKYLEGKSHDLSAFGTDLREWTNVKMSVKDRKVEITANDKLIWKDAYSENAGKIVGLRFSFLGAGSVKGIRYY